MLVSIFYISTINLELFPRNCQLLSSFLFYQMTFQQETVNYAEYEDRLTPKPN